jgi:hypothetical protein
MIRAKQSLEEIDRQLDSLGRARDDLSSLVARYVEGAGAGVQHGQQFEQLLATLNEAGERAELPATGDAEAPSAKGELQPAAEDHDDFELLVDDAEMDSIEDDQLATA